MEAAWKMKKKAEEDERAHIAEIERLKAQVMKSEMLLKENETKLADDAKRKRRDQKIIWERSIKLRLEATLEQGSASSSGSITFV